MRYPILLILTLSLSLGLYCPAVAQTDAEGKLIYDVIPPSPTVANLLKFEEVPVDLYTGQPSVVLPLYSRKLDEHVALNFSLQYATQGVQVDSRSGWVGTGWSLSGGGVIGRTVRGLPDEMMESPRFGILFNNDFWNYNGLSSDQKGEFNWNVVGTPTKKFDIEYDLYQYTYPGGSGRFIIRKAADGSLEPVLYSGEQRVRIQLYPNQKLELDSFLIIDPYGYRYTFRDIEQTETVYFYGTKIQNTFKDKDGQYSSEVVSARSAWHLSSICTPAGKFLAQFEYAGNGLAYLSSKNITYNHIISPHHPDVFWNDYNLSILKHKVIASYISLWVGAKVLSRVAFPDGTAWSLAPQPGLVHPETDGDVLGTFMLNNAKGDTLRSYTFNYHVENDRLWLQGLSENAGEKRYPYTFIYNQLEQLPPFGSPHDIWGYNNPGGNEPTENLRDPETVTIGLLSAIQYPTGGSKEFVFESHTYSYGQGTELTNDMLVRNLNNLTTKQKGFDLNGTYNTSYNDGVFYTNTHKFSSLAKEVDITLSFNVTDNSGTTSQADFLANSVLVVQDSTGAQYANLRLSQAQHLGIYLPAGEPLTFILRSLTLGEFQISGSIIIKYHEVVSDDQLQRYLYGGGARIKQVKFKNDSTTEVYSRVLNYTYADSLDPQKSSGAVDGILGNLSRDYIILMPHYLFGGTENAQESWNEKFVKYNVKSYSANVQLSKGNYVGYKHVRQYEVGAGHQDFSYTSAQDFFNPSDSAFTYPFLPTYDLDFKRGKLRSHSIYNEQGQLLEKTINDYTFADTVVASSPYVHTLGKCTWTQFYDEYVHYTNKAPSKNVPKCVPGELNYCSLIWDNCGEDAPFIYSFNKNLHRSIAYLTSTNTRRYTYPAGQQQLLQENRVSYTYNPFNYQLAEQKVLLNKDATPPTYRSTKYYYTNNFPVAADYSPTESEVLASLASANVINVPVYTEVLHNEQLIERHKKVYEVYSPSNLPAAYLGAYNTAIGNSPMEEIYRIVKYTDKGKVSEYKKKDGLTGVLKWGYEGQYPIVEAINATTDQIVYYGFEDDGNFIDDGKNGNVISDGKTGEKSLETTGFTINKPTQEEEYLISYYKNDGNEWVYYPPRTLTSAGLTLTGTIDEVRVYPVGAQMTTYTYKLGYGVSSVTDPNGQTSYYEYDGFGRLFQVKDDRGNILQQYEYQYVSEQTN